MAATAEKASRLRMPGIRFLRLMAGFLSEPDSEYNAARGRGGSPQTLYGDFLTDAPRYPGRRHCTLPVPVSYCEPRGSAESDVFRFADVACCRTPDNRPIRQQHSLSTSQFSQRAQQIADTTVSSISDAGDNMDRMLLMPGLHDGERIL